MDTQGGGKEGGGKEKQKAPPQPPGSMDDKGRGRMEVRTGKPSSLLFMDLKTVSAAFAMTLVLPESPNQEHQDPAVSGRCPVARIEWR